MTKSQAPAWFIDPAWLKRLFDSLPDKHPVSPPKAKAKARRAQSLPISAEQTRNPVGFLQHGLSKAHPALARSTSFAAGVGAQFSEFVPTAMSDDAVGEVCAALLEQPPGLTEADALDIVNRVATTFVQSENREGGENRKKKLWRRPVDVEQLVSVEDPVRAAELTQIEAAIQQLILSQPAELRHAMFMLSDTTASAAERSVRHIMEVTGHSRRTVARLQKELEGVASGLDLDDPGTPPLPGTSAGLGFGKQSAAVVVPFKKAAERGSDKAAYKPDMLGDFSFPKPREKGGTNGFE